MADEPAPHQKFEPLVPPTPSSLPKPAAKPPSRYDGCATFGLAFVAGLYISGVVINTYGRLNLHPFGDSTIADILVPFLITALLHGVGMVICFRVLRWPNAAYGLLTALGAIMVPLLLAGACTMSARGH